MNLSAYSLVQLQEAHRVLIQTGVPVPAVLIDLEEHLCDEIEWCSAETKHVFVSLFQKYLSALNKCTPTADMDEARLDQAWRAVRMAVEVLRSAPKAQ